VKSPKVPSFLYESGDQLVSDGSWKYRVHDPAGKETAEADTEAIYTTIYGKKWLEITYVDLDPVHLQTKHDESIFSYNPISFSKIDYILLDIN
jgi:hypothetical protein